MITFYVSYPTDCTAVIRYFYLKNSDANLEINPYLTKLNRKVFNLNIFKNNPASLPISSIMIVFLDLVYLYNLPMRNYFNLINVEKYEFAIESSEHSVACTSLDIPH